MIKIWIVHFEWHRKYHRFPRLHIYRKPRHGDRVMDGGLMGTLIACSACSGVGLLHDPDEYKLPEGVVPSLYPDSQDLQGS